MTPAMQKAHLIRRRNTLRYLRHAIKDDIFNVLWHELQEQEADFLNEEERHSNTIEIDSNTTAKLGDVLPEKKGRFESVHNEIQDRIRDCREVILETQHMIERLEDLKHNINNII